MPKEERAAIPSEPETFNTVTKAETSEVKKEEQA